MFAIKVIVCGAVLCGVAALVGAVVGPLWWLCFGRLELRLRDVRRRRFKPESLGARLLRDETPAPANGAAKGAAEFKPAWLARLERGSLETLLGQAGIPLKPRGFLLLAGSVGAVGLGIVAALGAPLWSWPVAAVVPPGMAFMLVLVRRRNRRRQAEQQLPAALDAISFAVRGGRSLESAIQSSAQVAHGPLADDLRSLDQSLQLGKPMAEAVAELANQTSSHDIKFLAAAIRMQQRTGGNLTSVIDRISRSIRQRLELTKQVQALTAEGRLSGSVLLALPVLAVASVYRLSPDYLYVLFTDPIGKKLLAGAIILQLIGAVTIRRMVTW